MRIESLIVGHQKLLAFAGVGVYVRNPSPWEDQELMAILSYTARLRPASATRLSPKTNVVGFPVVLPLLCPVDSEVSDRLLSLEISRALGV